MFLKRQNFFGSMLLTIILLATQNPIFAQKFQPNWDSLRDKYDKFGGRASGSREMFDSKVADEEISRK